MADTGTTSAHIASVPSYLAGLRLAGRRVLVVGAGTVTARRLPALVAAQAQVVIVAPAATPAVRRLAADGAVQWQPRTYRAGDVAGAWYVLAATDDPACNAAVAAAAESAQVFCARADDRHSSSAWTPATAEIDGATLGVLTGDPRRTRQLRNLLADVLRRRADGTGAPGTAA